MARIGLAGLLDRLDRALDELGPDRVAAVLRRHLAQLPPAARESFVEAFEAPADLQDDALVADVTAYVDHLPAAVEALNEHRWRSRRARRRGWADDRGDDVPSPLQADVDDLYRRLGERFLAGDLATAVAGYRRLLDATLAALDDPDGFHVAGSDDVAREGCARLARAVLADTSVTPAERARAAVEALDAYRPAVATPRIAEVLDAHPDPLPDEQGVLRACRDVAGSEARARRAWEGHHLHDLYADLTLRLDGLDALAAIAGDASYPHRYRAYDAWLDGLEAAGRTADAIAVAAEALAGLQPSYPRADLADRLAHLHRTVGNRPAAADATLAAFGDHPTLRRLRQLCDDTDGTVDALGEAITTASSRGEPVVQAAALVLVGRLDALPTRPPAGRLDHGDWTAVTVAALLLASRPPADDTAARLAHELLATVDRPERDYGVLRRAPTHDPSPLTPRLVAALSRQRSLPARLARARQIVDDTAADVLGAKDRPRYGTVALLVVALAHATAAIETTGAADTIADYDGRYRRFSAFRSELRDAAAAAHP